MNKNGKDFTICLQSWLHDIISSLGGFRAYLVGQSVNGILQVYFPQMFAELFGHDLLGKEDSEHV